MATTKLSERKAEEKRGGIITPESEFPSLNRMRQEFDDLLNKFFDGMPALWNAERADHRWAFNVEDQPDAYMITAEAPGFESDDFHVELRGDQLVLRARRAEETTEEEGEKSFTSSEFYRSMTIPPYVDTARIEATYKSDVLSVSLPKTEESKGRTIPVKG